MWQFTKRVGPQRQTVADYIMSPLFKGRWTPWCERFRVWPVRDINRRFIWGQAWTRSRIIGVDSVIVTETEWVSNEFDMIRAEDRDRKRSDAQPRERYSMNWFRP